MAYFKILCHCIYLKIDDDFVLLFVYYFNALSLHRTAAAQVAGAVFSQKWDSGRIVKL